MWYLINSIKHPRYNSSEIYYTFSLRERAHGESAHNLEGK